MADEEVVEKAPAGPAAGIARGRMHAALVYAIKFNSGEKKDGEIARTFATTPGKVNDIRKDRNFKYVTSDLSFTAAEIQEAKDRFKASVNADNSTVDAEQREIAVEDAELAIDGVPTTDGDSQLSNVRKADRKPRGAAKESDGDEAEAVAETVAEPEEDLEAILEA